MINMLRALINKGDDMQALLGNVSRGGNSKKEWKRSAGLQKHCSVTEMKSAFDGLIVRLDPAEKRIFEPEDIQ